MIRITYTARGKATVFEHAGSQLVIGRPKTGAACDLDLSHDTNVSRPHARVFVETDRYWIEDLNSKRGTKLNGQEIKGRGKRELREGDVVAIGQTPLRIDRADAADDDATSSLGLPGSILPPEPQPPEPAVNFGPCLDAKARSTFQADPAALDGDRRIALLCELPLKFARESRLENLLQTIVGRVVDLIPGAARGALLLVDPAQGDLVLKAHLPVGQPAVSLTLARRAVERREGFIWELGQEESTGSILRHGIGTGMYAPLVWREEVVGVLCVDNPRREVIFAKEDLRLLMGVAHYAAMAVTHQRTLDELMRHADLTNRLFSSRFAPHLRKNLVQAAANGSLPIGTRQSHVTVLIADIRGFTQLTARLGAQRTGDLLNEYFPPLVEAVLAHNGAIERFIGDAVFAVFGSPEHDSAQHENAVRAALAMQEASAAVMKSRSARQAETCEIGIGIDCGEALHGFIGNAERLEFRVIGEPANVASRYCAAAGKGEILLSPELHSHVFNQFQTDRIEFSAKHEGSMVAYRLRH